MVHMWAKRWPMCPDESGERVGNGCDMGMMPSILTTLAGTQMYRSRILLLITLPVCHPVLLSPGQALEINRLDVQPTV